MCRVGAIPLSIVGAIALTIVGAIPLTRVGAILQRPSRYDRTDMRGRIAPTIV